MKRYILSGEYWVKATEALEVEKQRDALQEKVNVAVEALEAIKRYGLEGDTQDGCCRYGCDTPSIAGDTLAKLKGMP